MRDSSDLSKGVVHRYGVRKVVVHPCVVPDFVHLTLGLTTPTAKLRASNRRCTATPTDDAGADCGCTLSQCVSSLSSTILCVPRCAMASRPQSSASLRANGCSAIMTSCLSISENFRLASFSVSPSPPVMSLEKFSAPHLRSRRPRRCGVSWLLSSSILAVFVGGLYFHTFTKGL